MGIETLPVTPASGTHFGSDVESLCYVDGKLDVVLVCSQDNEGNLCRLRVRFAEPTGFRFLDELDLARYWISAGFSRGSHVLEVTGGGWSAEEDLLQTYETKRREWLVVSGNACVNVFCALPPEVAELAPDRLPNPDSSSPEFDC